ncbi:MAG: hypothetical protein SD837_18550 [Candidatus Electrothrix scaldis]|nr:MAG: hypothetical protein SD837_18550 [Candidatus Electrothrix sp. GW3-3]
MSKQTEVHGDNFGSKGTQAVAKDKGTVIYEGVSAEVYAQAIREETRATMKAELLAEHVKELEECFREIRAGEPVDQAIYVQIEILLKRNKR